MLTNPRLDYAEHCLHGSLHVDLSGRVVREFKWTDQFEPMPLVGQAYRARAVYRPILASSQPREERIDPARVSEEGNIDALGIVLVHQHANQPPIAKRLEHFARRSRAGLYQTTGEQRTCLDEPI